jgi:hypothetical protein
MVRMYRALALRGPRFAQIGLSMSLLVLLCVGGMRLLIPDWPLALVAPICALLVASMMLGVLVSRSLVDFRDEITDDLGRRVFRTTLLMSYGWAATDIASLTLTVTSMQ